MTADLDSLATALYVKTDDLLKDSPHLAPRRPAVGIAPQLAEELVTPVMMQTMLGFTSEAKWPETPALGGPAVMAVAPIHRPRQRVDRAPGRNLRPGARSVVISGAG
ncbi:hypothetical protein ACFRQM_43050 [Streptomyces sp. NPDC056831]|uniref:hypothetical protein n=1 Tax=Streptomyces sp. NPDC056831 TaxID=3345954 RepID=UPI0036B5785E